MWHSCRQAYQFAGPLAPCAEHFVIEHTIADGSCFDVVTLIQSFGSALNLNVRP
jgi:hypothetical protein